MYFPFCNLDMYSFPCGSQLVNQKVDLLIEQENTQAHWVNPKITYPQVMIQRHESWMYPQMESVNPK